MKPITDGDLAVALSRLPEKVVQWFEESLQQQLQDNMIAEAPHDKWGQGKAQALDEICRSIKNAKNTADKLNK